MLKRCLTAAFVGVAAAALAFGAVACGGDDDEDGDAAETPAATTAAPTGGATTAPTTDAGGGGGDGFETINITAADFSFDADLSSVGPGSVVEVKFSNSGSTPHTVNFYTDAEYEDAIPGGESGQVSGGGSVNFTFEAPESGTAFFRCEVHPTQMQGELSIE